MASKIKRVDPTSVVPKYFQLAEILRQKIENNEWQVGDPMPAERELESIYGVSRTTVREALNYLENEGHVYREHGRGTFVARPKMEHSLHLLRSFTDDMQGRGFVAGQRILGVERITPSNRTRQQLELSSAMEQVVRVERMRLANDEPIGIHVAYLALSPEQIITAEELQDIGSLYALLQSKFNLVPIEANQSIEATIASRREADLLEVEVGTPLLLVERTTFSQQRQPMEFVKMLYRADRYKYHLHVTR